MTTASHENHQPQHGQHHAQGQMYHLIVDNKEHPWPVEHITGLEIKELAKVDPEEYSVWEVIAGPGDDIEIPNDKEVDLKPPVKHFITGKKHSTEG